MRRFLEREVAVYSSLPELSTWQQHIESARPFVARSVWRPDVSISKARELAGEIEVIVRDLTLGPEGDGEVLLRDLVDCLGQEGQIWYARQQRVPASLEQFVPLACIPEVLRRDFAPNMWIGSRGSHTNLHRDFSSNVTMQVEGTKQFTLLSPCDDEALYPAERFSMTGDYAKLKSVYDVDLATFPKFRDAVPLPVELHPGDMLFLPSYWWHEVHSPEDSFMFNVWSRPPLEVALRPDIEQLAYSSSIALGIILNSILPVHDSDFEIIAELESRGAPLMAAIVLQKIADRFVSEVQKADWSSDLLPEATVRILEDSRRLDTDAVDLLQVVAAEAEVAARRLGTRPPYPSLTTKKWSEELALAHRRYSITPPTRIRQTSDALFREIGDASFSRY